MARKLPSDSDRGHRFCSLSASDGTMAGPLWKPGRKENKMLWTIAVLLLILWFLGMISSYTMGGFIHILLLLAIVTVLIRVIQGRRPV